jgi:hypothetical protein
MVVFTVILPQSALRLSQSTQKSECRDYELRDFCENLCDSTFPDFLINLYSVFNCGSIITLSHTEMVVFTVILPQSALCLSQSTQRSEHRDYELCGLCENLCDLCGLTFLDFEIAFSHFTLLEELRKV